MGKSEVAFFRIFSVAFHLFLAPLRGGGALTLRGPLIQLYGLTLLNLT